MKRALLLLVTAGACAPRGPAANVPDSLEVARAAATITAADARDRIAFLAADELRGRDTPSPGLERAAQWVADEMAAFGLEPAGDDGWFQRYPYPAEGLDPARTTLTVSAGATHSFEYGRDFFAWRGADLPGSVGAVYVGGAPLADAPVGGADGDGGSLRERAMVVRLDGPPDTGARGLRVGVLTGAAQRARAAARQAGAVAVVFVLDPRVTPEDVAEMAREAERTDRVLGGLDPSELPLPTFFMLRPAADRMLGMAGLEPDALLGGDPVRPVPIPGVTLGLATPGRVVDDSRPPNVVGRLRGWDPELRDSYVVLSAHMDHVGVGRPDADGDSIYNGADDDASGTAVLVEVAQAMARLDPPRRSLLFLVVSGEEKGLLGSRWFSEHPTVPMDSIVANINLDMVARNAPDSIVVIGQEYSSLGRTLHDVARRHHDELGLTVSEDLWPEQRFFFRSDHFNFARKEVPALFFFAGTHEDYHRPGDEVDGIDADKVARVGRLVFYLTRTLIDGDDAPEWTRDGLKTIRRLTR